MWKSERVKATLAVVGGAVLTYSGFIVLFGERAVPTAYAQSDAFLSRRIDAIENRFYGLESRLNRLETESRPIGITPQTTRTDDLEIQFLRSQVDALRTRLGEAECGLLRLDERTLTPASRSTRDKAAVNAEPCRRDTSAVVKLSARP